MDSHYRTLGILFIAFAVVKVLFLIWGVYMIEVFQAFLPQEAEVMLAVFAAKILAISLIVTGSALFALTGYGLLRKKKWGLVMALVMGIIALSLFPLGTALGLYAIIVFLMAQSPTYNPELNQQSGNNAETHSTNTEQA